MSKNVKTIFGRASQGVLVDVECHISNSLPNIVIVGFASKSIDEAKERIRGAFTTSNIRLPKKRIALNLAPADLPKDGSSSDLAMAIAIMQQAELVPYSVGSDSVVIGELSLDGVIRPVRGIIGKIVSAQKLGINKFIIPHANLKQANMVPGIEILPLKSLREVYMALQQPDLVLKNTQQSNDLQKSDHMLGSKVLMEDIVGQHRAKRAALIAAAGSHNIFLNGPPGTGKSMLAKALPSILPPMSPQEMLEVTHLHSLASHDYGNVISSRPIRTPHHSSSQVSIIGGGQNPRPGEISLSHHGVLFFDEFPEFSRSVIEALRQPLEDKKITVARAKDSLDFPASFILVATANPCPCGYFNSSRECTCLPHQIVRYQKRISGPVIDRIDLYVDIEEVAHASLLNRDNHESVSSKKLRSTVKRVRETQLRRNGKLNSDLNNKELKTTISLSEEAKELLDAAAEKMNLSARGYMRTLRVARTIADINDNKRIEPEDISEALQYRKKPIEL